jgi:hypothetical protein
LMEGVKTWLSSQAADLLDTSVTIPTVTTLKSSLNMCVLSVYNNLFLIACFVNRSPEVTFRIALIYIWVYILSRVWATTDAVWIGNWIHWTLIERNYK